MIERSNFELTVRHGRLERPLPLRELWERFCYMSILMT